MQHRWQWAWLVAVGLVAGCGPDADPDPANDRLDTGQEALLHSDSSDVVAVMQGERTSMQPVGVRVDVVDDSAPDPEKSHRKTTVKLKEGELSGKSGRVYRDNLRAITTKNGY